MPRVVRILIKGVGVAIAVILDGHGFNHIDDFVGLFWRRTCLFPAGTADDYLSLLLFLVHLDLFDDPLDRLSETSFRGHDRFLLTFVAIELLVFNVELGHALPELSFLVFGLVLLFLEQEEHTCEDSS